MNIKFAFLLIIFVTATSSTAFTQRKSGKNPAQIKSSPTEKKIETNSKSAKPSLKETFESADVKTMAMQCVTLATEKGFIELEMYPESAPETVRNFLNLAGGGYFDSTVFSRVVPDFIIQGGDLSTGNNWSAETAKRAARTVVDEPNSIKHERGVVSMARLDEPDTATTHFFILLRASDSLDGSFAAFGRVRNGMEVVEAINKLPVEGEKPVAPVRINKATVAVCPAKTLQETK